MDSVIWFIVLSISTQISIIHWNLIIAGFWVYSEISVMIKKCYIDMQMKCEDLVFWPLFKIQMTSSFLSRMIIMFNSCAESTMSILIIYWFLTVKLVHVVCRYRIIQRSRPSLPDPFISSREMPNFRTRWKSWPRLGRRKRGLWVPFDGLQFKLFLTSDLLSFV